MRAPADFSATLPQHFRRYVGWQALCSRDGEVRILADADSAPAMCTCGRRWAKAPEPVVLGATSRALPVVARLGWKTSFAASHRGEEFARVAAYREDGGVRRTRRPCRQRNHGAARAGSGVRKVLAVLESRRGEWVSEAELGQLGVGNVRAAVVRLRDETSFRVAFRSEDGANFYSLSEGSNQC